MADGRRSNWLPGRLTLLQSDNLRMVSKLALIAALMFGFGYALVPIYRSICSALGINVLSLSELKGAGLSRTLEAYTQVDATRTIAIEFDANARGVWDFKPLTRSVNVHPGEMTTVLYDFVNIQNRTMVAQAIPSYAPNQAMAYFKKVECFCFREYSLKAGESKRWPVTFVIDPKLPKDVKTITLSYTFFEVPGKIAPDAAAAQAVPPEPGS